MQTVSFLVSGRGTNFVAVAKKILDKTIPAKFGILVSDKIDAGALERASEMGIISRAIPREPGMTREEHENMIIEVMQSAGTDLIVAAGYMRILSPLIINAYINRIINIHPALLPSFPGVKAQEQAFLYGVKITGCTAHFIDEGTDTGPIILQSTVFVENNDTIATLSEKILREEHRILPEAVKLYCQDRLKVLGNKVIIS